MKQYITLGLVLFIGLFSLSTVAQTVIFSEDFASITTGDNTTTNGSNNLWAGNENFTVAATNSKAYEAGGAVRLGAGAATGYILSVPLDLSQGGGNFTLSFDVKGWTNVEGNIKVNITGLAEQTGTYTATRTDAFETITLNFTGGTANSTIRIETSAKRAFIDNVSVTIADVIAVPVATAATGITYGQFTANWNTVADATGYRLDVSTAADFSSFVTGYENLAVTGTSHTVTGLTSNTMYHYRVRAEDGTGVSDNSNVIDLTTACGPFVFPTEMEAAFCGSATVADLPANGGSYKWYAAQTGGTALNGNVALATGTYYLTHTVNTCESDRMAFDVTVTVVNAPAAENMAICNSGTVADLMPNGENYKWYADATTTTALPATTALENGTYYVARVMNSCESERTSIEVSINIPAAPAGASPQEFTAGETLADLDVTAVGDLVWYSDIELTTELPATTVLTDGTTYYAVNMDGTCPSASTSITANATAGLSSTNMPGLKYYPNPVKDNFTVSYTDTLDTITVYNMLGQVVIANNAKATTAELNTSGLTAGTYFVKVVSGAQAKTVKVVKQ